MSVCLCVFVCACMCECVSVVVWSPLCPVCRVREALIYLAHAYQSNASLLKKGERRGVKQSVIALYRRKCLAVSTVQWRISGTI